MSIEERGGYRVYKCISSTYSEIDEARFITSKCVVICRALCSIFIIAVSLNILHILYTYIYLHIVALFKNKKIPPTYLQAGSPTSLKNTHVPPFKQKALPTCGHSDPRFVQLLGGAGKYP